MTDPNDLPKHVSTEQQTAGACKASSARQPYRAFEVSGEIQRHLEIRRGYPEPAESPSYATLTSISYDWRMGTGMSISYGKTMLVSIRGDNLTAISQAVKDGRAKWIAEFNAEDYDPPTDETAPFIKSIVIHTTRPEDPPPRSKLH